MKQTNDSKEVKSPKANSKFSKGKMTAKERGKLIAEEMIANLRNPNCHGKTI